MTIETLTAPVALAALGPEWERLAARAGQRLVFGGWHWNRLWWEHYGHLGTLHILVLREGGETVAIAPLYRTRTRALGLVPLDTLRFVGRGGDTAPDDLDIIADPARRESAAARFADHLVHEARWQRLVLEDLPRGGAFHRALLARLRRRPGWLREGPVHARLEATLPDGWEGWLAARGRGRRKRYRRRTNRLAAAGVARFSPCRDAATVERAREALIRLHRLRRAGGSAGAFRSNAYIGFHRALMHALLPRGELSLLTLELDGEIIGVEYGYRVGDTLSFFQSGFDLRHERLAPGHLLMSEAIRLAISDGLARIDLLRGDHPYKREYGDRWLESIDLDFVRAPRLLGTRGRAFRSRRRAPR